MPDNELEDFIDKARKRGFADNQIKEALLNNGWPIHRIDQAFDSLNPKFKSKNQVNIFLSDELLDILEKRAKKNMQTVSEQIEEILQKSCVNYKGSKSPSLPEKLDDNLIGLFSRKNTGPKGKRK